MTDPRDNTPNPPPTWEYQCHVCGYGSDNGKEWRMYFCPSYPDKCAGCEVHEDRLQCPECMHEWEIG